jgi:hypothetical protein
MSLDFCLLETKPTEVFSRNITHNLGKMAKEAGIYMHLWRPDELGIKTASELIDPLRVGLELLKSDPERFEAFNAPNGWGLYKHFVPFVEACLKACIDHPNAEVYADR